MSSILIKEQDSEKQFALFDIGFRPMFLAAAIFAVVAMGLWLGLYYFAWGAGALQVAPMTWHAHEMIYGYGLAVIAGFLLTAVRNWTGLETLQSTGLQVLILLWVSARVGFWLADSIPLLVLAVLDNLFILYLLVATAVPIIRVKQRRQLAILTALVLFLAGNVAFYAGLMGYLSSGVQVGLYSGFYLTLLLILIISRRVFPMFIQNGLKDIHPDVSLANRLWIDVSIIILFIAFASVVLFTSHNELAGFLAFLLGVLNCVRLAGWYVSGIWKKPLVWVLYVSHIWLIVGFFLTALSGLTAGFPYIAIHALAVGVIGTVTIGMMARVSLGHTGRNILNPPFSLTPLFLLMTSAAIVRVVFPLLWIEYYQLWVGLSQVLWILAFTLFLVRYTMILIRPRFESKPE